MMSKYTDKQLIQVIDTLIKNNTEYPKEDFTGGSIGVTLVNNATLLKYKFTMYFGFKNKNAISKVIEVDKNIYNILVDALEVKTKSLLDGSNKLSLDDIQTILTTGSKVGINTKGTTSTKTNTNTIITKTIITKTNESEKDKQLNIFSLKNQKLLSSTSKEYQEKLKEYIENSKYAMSYEDFYNQCEMKPYKYKNFTFN